jgi:hypothetical protein
MREEPSILENVSESPLFGRDINSLVGIEIRLGVDHDSSFVRANQTGHHVDHGRLSGS